MSTPIALAHTVERWPIAGSSGISRGSKTEAIVVVAELSDGECRGRGECVPYARFGESVDSVVAQIDAMRPKLECGSRSPRIAEFDAARRGTQCA